MITRWKPPTSPDPLLNKSRHQAMKAILLKSIEPAECSWWARVLSFLDRVWLIK